jgi:hypothetical protein
MFSFGLPRLTTVLLVLVLFAAGLAPAWAQQGGFAAAVPLVSQAKARLDQRRYDEAADLYQRALTIPERDPDKNRTYIIDTLTNLARGTPGDLAPASSADRRIVVKTMK